VIEIMRFRLAPGADEAGFREADKAVQSEFAYHQEGLLRRTTAVDREGAWIVIDLWQSGKAADAAEARWGQDPVTAAFMSFIDPATISTERYAELD
jgi:hypothetical protein